MKFGTISIKETNHIWFNFLFHLTTFSSKELMIAFLFPGSAWHACFGLAKEQKVVHLYAPGVANTGQRAAQLSGKA